MTRTIVITGASRGIGAATARLAGQRGWSVAVNYVGNETAARETAAAVEAAGGRAIVVKGDVSSETDVVALFEATAKAFGVIHGVVNNAGIAEIAMKLADMSVERLRRTAEINIVGAQLVARESVRRMAKSRGGEGGVLVNLSSAAARIGGANERVDYGASKGALDTLTIGLSKEVGPEGIRVVAVRPGLIETDIHVSGGQPGRLKELGGDGAARPVGEGRGGCRKHRLAALGRGFVRQRRDHRHHRRPIGRVRPACPCDEDP